MGFSPPDEYLVRLGRATWAVAYFEAGVLSSTRFIPDLPDDMTWRWFDSNRKTTRQIGRKLAHDADRVASPIDQAWLKGVGGLLVELAERRRLFLHANPIVDEHGDGILARGDPWTEITAHWLDEFYGYFEELIQRKAALGEPSGFASG